jgi:hypothetical protein
MIEYYLPQAVVLIICDLTQSEGEYYPSLYSWGRTHAFTQTLLDERLLVILNFFWENLRLSEFRAALPQPWMAPAKNRLESR